MTDDRSSLRSERIAAIRARLAKLPRGPWYIEHARPGREDEARVYDVACWGVCKPTPNDPAYRRPIAEFVVNAPSDLEWLLAELDRLARDRAVCEVCWTNSWDPTPNADECAWVHPHEGEHMVCGYCRLYEAYRRRTAQARPPDLRQQIMSLQIPPTANWAPVDWCNGYAAGYRDARAAAADAIEAVLAAVENGTER